MKFDRKKFFDGTRELLRKAAVIPPLTQLRVDALEFLITEFEKTDWDIPWIAYAFATMMRETASTFEPITEYGQRSYFDKYEPGTRIGKRLGNIHKGDGYKYRGRGYVQLTGRTNYTVYGIAGEPDKALDPAKAFKIMIHGMENGAFTGKKLGDYINAHQTDYANARQVINGMDHYALIAAWADGFEKILKDAEICS